MEFLPGLSIQYLAGGANVVPDRLSRRADYLTAMQEGMLGNVSSAHSSFLR